MKIKWISRSWNISVLMPLFWNSLCFNKNDPCRQWIIILDNNIRLHFLLIRNYFIPRDLNLFCQVSFPIVILYNFRIVTIAALSRGFFYLKLWHVLGQNLIAICVAKLRLFAGSTNVNCSCILIETKSLWVWPSFCTRIQIQPSLPMSIIALDWGTSLKALRDRRLLGCG